MQTYRALIRNRRFMYYYIAEVLSRCGDAMHRVALMVTFYRLTESGLALGILMFLRVAPEVFFGPFAGVWADRFDRRTLIVVSDLTRGLAVLCLFFWNDHVLSFYLVTLCVALGTSAHHPAKYGLIPQLVGQEDLLTANSLMSGGANLALILGALLGGVLLTVSGPGLVFALNALTFFAAATVAWFTLPACLAAVGPVTRSVWRSLTDGLTFIRQSPRVLGVVLASSAMWVGIAVSDAILIVFVGDTLALPDSMFGYLRTVIGVGSIVGALITPWIARKQSVEYQRLLTSVALVGLLFGALALSMSFWDTMLFYVLGCVAATVAENLTVTVLQRVPHDLRGRIVASCNAIDTLGYMVVVTISPWLTDILPVRLVLMMGGAIILVAIPIARLASRVISANASAGTG